MEGRSYEGVRLGDLQIDEEMWGPGSTPVIRAWLAEHYDPATMPTLTASTIKGREGIWLLGWNAEGTDYPSLLHLIFGEGYAQQRLEQNKADLIEGRTVLCPRCRFNRYTPYGLDEEMRAEWLAENPFPALSRTDNATYICTPCGSDEAMRDFRGLPLEPPTEWPVMPTGSFGVGRP